MSRPPIVPGWEGDSLLPEGGWRAAAPAAAFWIPWGVACALLHRTPWLVLAAQLWLAYSVVWLALAVQAHRARPATPTLLWIAIVSDAAAVVGEALALPLAPDFEFASLLAVDTWIHNALLPLFALALHLPAILRQARQARLHAASLERARQSAALAELSRQLTVAELRTLQAQVEPHFLYNTLASVQYLVRHDPARADAMLTHLHDYLRNALPTMRAPQSTLRREFALARSYLALIALRLGDRLVVDVELPDALAATPFPPLMLATLVENAVKHGVEPALAPVRVSVRAARVGGLLEVSVVDDGRGLLDGSNAGPPADAGRAGAPGSGVGLANVAERLASLHGAAASLVVESNEPRGVRAVIRIPA